MQRTLMPAQRQAHCDGDVMTRFVHIDLAHPDCQTQTCRACGSQDLLLQASRYPVVDFLEPVRGAPYPTYAAQWWNKLDVTCRTCGCHYGWSEPEDSTVPPEELPYDRLDRVRIDDPQYVRPDLFGWPGE